MVNSELVHRRRWKILVVLCLALSITSIDTTVLSVALPRIVEDVDASGSQLQWIVDSYTIVFACLLLAAGALGDRFGRRGALIGGVATFGVFSLVASASQTPTQLILARALLGGAGAFIFPTTLSLLTNVFTDPRERSRAIGIWSALAGIGVAIGPPLGGILVEHLGWHSVFWVNAPICLGTVVAAIVIVPHMDTEAARPLDPVGALISVVAMVGLLYAIIELPNGWDAGVIAGFVESIVGMGLFAWWESRVAHPMLDVHFFRNPRFSAASAVVFLMMFAMYASTFLMTQYFQFTLGYSPLKTGLMLTPLALGMMASSTQAARVVERFGTKAVAMGGTSILAGSMFLYGSDTIMSSFTIGFAVRFVYGIGLGFCGPPLTESIMGSLPPERAGVGSAVNDTTRQLGGALGVAVLGSIFATRYHHAMDRVTGIPAAVRDEARESIGTTINVASRLDDPGLAARVRDAGIDAFHHSMRLTYAIGGAVLVGAMYIVWRYLPAKALETHHHHSVEIASEPPLAAAVDLDN
jgi:EmrB/QacA subfamily drug resistance transporter